MAAQRRKQNLKVEIDNSNIAIEIDKITGTKEASKHEAINREMSEGKTATTRTNKAINSVANQIIIKPMTLHKSPEATMNVPKTRTAATIIGMKNKTDLVTRHSVVRQARGPKIQTSEGVERALSLKPRSTEIRIQKMILL